MSESSEHDKTVSKLREALNRWPPGSAPTERILVSEAGKTKPTGADLFKLPLVDLNKDKLATGPRDPDWPAIDIWKDEGEQGVGLSRRRAIRKVEIFAGRDGREYMQTEFLGDPPGSHWAANPLIEASDSEVDSYAISVLAAWNFPRPGFGYVWEDEGGTLCWGRRLPQGKDRASCRVEELAGDVAEKFLWEWPAERCQARGLPDGSEVVFASQWLSLRDALVEFRGLEEGIGRTARGFDLPCDRSDPKAAAFDGYKAGVEVGMKCGGLLYEWRLFKVHGRDVLAHLRVKGGSGLGADTQATNAIARSTEIYSSMVAYYNPLLAKHCTNGLVMNYGAVADFIREHWPSAGFKGGKDAQREAYARDYLERTLVSTLRKHGLKYEAAKAGRKPKSTRRPGVK